MLECEIHSRLTQNRLSCFRVNDFVVMKDLFSVKSSSLNFKCLKIVATKTKVKQYYYNPRSESWSFVVSLVRFSPGTGHLLHWHHWSRAASIYDK